MRRALATLILLVAGAACVGGARRLARALAPTPLELGRAATERLEPATRARLEALNGEVQATYWVSPRDRMPSDMRRQEALVRALLERMSAASDGRFRASVLHPEEEPELADYLAHQGIAPFRARSVRHDEWSEREVYSTLTLSSGGRGVARVAGLRAEHNPVLQRLIVAHLDELEHPTRPVVALSGPHTERLAAYLSRRADVRRIDFDREPRLPPDADVFFWVAPDVPNPAVRARALRLFLEGGGSAVVAGSDVELELVREPGRPVAVRRLPETRGLALALAEVGLDTAPGVLLDEQSARLAIDGRPLPAPWRVRCIASNQDFRGLVGQPNGTILFDSPTAWRWDPAELEERGLAVRALATTGESTWIEDLNEPQALSDLAPTARTQVARQTLAALVEPRDPWRGRLAAFGSAAPFQDEEFANEATSHPSLAGVLLDTLASAERRVLRRAALQRAEPLPPPAPGERIAWRAVGVLTWPLLLGALLLVRLVRSRRRAPASRADGARLAPGGAALLALAAGALFAALWRALPLDGALVDATRGRVHRLDPTTRDLCRALGAPVEAELVFSSPLPPGLRAGLLRLRGRLALLERAGLDLALRTVPANDLNEGERTAWADRGVLPKPLYMEGEDARSVRRLYASLVLVSGERQVVLDFPAPIAFENLEFRLAVALWTLREGRAPRVAVAADVPRLSPAEAHVEYQSRGLFAPTGGDVYSIARELLRLVGFEVVTVDPRAPDALASGPAPDALLWLQPRRNVEPMMAALASHLAGGGRALVAAQHFEIRSRQPRDEGLAVVHWPQPQYPDLESGYIAELGATLERDVLFDRVSGRLSVRAEVERSADGRDFEVQESAQPYLVRATARGLDATIPMVAGLGDLLFASGNRIALDEGRLAARGLTPRVLMRTSPDAWVYAWSGGDLPEGALAGRAPEAEPVGAAPLAVRLDGTFPPLEADVFGPAATRPGTLVLAGASAPFQNDLILDPAYDHAGFLWNATAELALGPELGRVMARRTVPQGFPPPTGTRRLWLRAAVLAVLPLALGLVALARLAASRRRPLAAASGGERRARHQGARGAR